MRWIRESEKIWMVQSLDGVGWKNANQDGENMTYIFGRYAFARLIGQEIRQKRHCFSRRGGEQIS